MICVKYNVFQRINFAGRQKVHNFEQIIKVYNYETVNHNFIYKCYEFWFKCSEQNCKD